MGNMIIHTIAFVIVNVLIAIIISSANGVNVNYDTSQINVEYNDTYDSFDGNNVKDINKYTVTESDFSNSNVPSWFIDLLLLIDGVWIVAIIFGWVRGTS